MKFWSYISICKGLKHFHTKERDEIPIFFDVIIHI